MPPRSTAHDITLTRAAGTYNAACTCRRFDMSDVDEKVVREAMARHIRTANGGFDVNAAPSVQAPAVDPHEATRVRTDDYDTSIEGAQTVSRRAGNQRLALLAEYHRASAIWNGDPARQGMTDEEAGEAAGLLGSCYWKRCGELRASGWTTWHPDALKRKGHAGVNRRVSVLTDEGRAALARREGAEDED